MTDNKYKIGTYLPVTLKTIFEIGESYKNDGFCFQHPTGGLGATLTIKRDAREYFGTQVTATLKYIKPDRNIWEFTFGHKRTQMIYDDWFTESIFEKELFEI